MPHPSKYVAIEPVDRVTTAAKKIWKIVGEINDHCWTDIPQADIASPDSLNAHQASTKVAEARHTIRSTIPEMTRLY